MGPGTESAVAGVSEYGYTSGQILPEDSMRFATVAELKNQLSKYLARARQKREPILVTLHGRPYALIQPISARDLETLDWQRLADQRLRDAWDKDDDALYDYL